MKFLNRNQDSYSNMMKLGDSSKPGGCLVFLELDMGAEAQGLGVEVFCLGPGNNQ